MMSAAAVALTRGLISSENTPFLAEYTAGAHIKVWVQCGYFAVTIAQN